MREESEKKNKYKAVEEKSESPNFGTSSIRLIAGKDFKISRAGFVFKVKAGDDVTDLPEEKLELLRSNGVI
jgi:hypothetical protein